MARPMTPAEKARFKGYFPSLDVNKAVVTDGPSAAYILRMARTETFPRQLLGL